MASQTQPSTQPRKIVIRPWSFNSDIANTLVSALDAELEEMYPDWQTLPHPGFDKFVGGDHDPEPWTNPVPVLDALDADVNTTNNNLKPIKLPTKDALTPSDLSTLHFHIAFDITDLPPNTNTNTNTNTDTPSTPLPSLGIPVGCIGLKTMPNFPSHRPTPTSPAHPASNPFPHPRHAELKRLYISPSHRSPTQITTPSNPHPTRLTQALISTVQEFARDRLGVDKIVLETGVRQLAAIKLYERLGWTRIPDYGDYIGAGEGDGGVSRCYVLDL